MNERPALFAQRSLTSLRASPPNGQRRRPPQRIRRASRSVSSSARMSPS
eukprot:CAMPEP_0175581520 /NCGR_PEP_ID=MMETSP0096-20121207/47663_1 /TAXON_ID=311494 /ORGANISM="Alexandrium monilatum, Strain CCMP3105" /LENGTH=48 /DNA_ID= /DNA_START= /DNA_END= /DNA_ORIENTATION=